MDNYTPSPFITQPIYDPTRPFATPSCNIGLLHNRNFDPSHIQAQIRLGFRIEQGLVNSFSNIVQPFWEAVCEQD